MPRICTFFRWGLLAKVSRKRFWPQGIVVISLLLGVSLNAPALDHGPFWTNGNTECRYGLPGEGSGSLYVDEFSAGSDSLLKARQGVYMWESGPSILPDVQFWFSKLTTGACNNAAMDNIHPGGLYMWGHENEGQDDRKVSFSTLGVHSWDPPTASDAGSFLRPNPFNWGFWSWHILYRYLTMTDDQLPGITNDIRRYVILIHGWNSDQVADGYTGPHWGAVTNAIEDYFATNGVTSWKLLKYHMERDTDTGGLGDPIGNPSEAAEATRLHGYHMAELILEKCPEVEAVHLIAHSAGAWAARSAFQYLTTSTNAAAVRVQMTLLDGFIPGEINAESYLDAAAMDAARNVAFPHKVYGMDNYYTVTDIALGTDHWFDWGSFELVSDVNIDLYLHGGDWSMHDGPLNYYADSVETPGNWGVTNFVSAPPYMGGWPLSMAYQDISGPGLPVTLFEVQSDHAVNPDPGYYWVDAGTALTSQAPTITQGDVQYESTGWSLAEHEPGTGSTMEAVFVITNDTVLTWHWQTNYLVQVDAPGGSLVLDPSGWQPRGTTLTASCTSSGNLQFAGWLGDVPPGRELDNPLTFPADQPRSITAYFTALGDWANSMDITPAGYDRPEVLSNFPLRVVLQEGVAGFSHEAVGSPPGSDLRFTTGDGSIFLNYEIEAWNTNDKSYAWVRIPEFSTTTVIRAYWGNTNGLDVPAYLTNGYVWAENFLGVWHLDGIDDPLADSTARGNDGAGINTSRTDGVTAGAMAFNGSSTYINCGNSPGLKPTNELTISAWVWPGLLPDYREIYRKEDGSARHLLSFQHDGTILSFGAAIGSGGYAELDVPISLADYTDGWHLVTATYDGTSKKLYRDGIEIGSADTNGLLATAGTDPGVIGSYRGSSEFFNGAIDEVRVSGSGRSSNWVWATWANGALGTNFLVSSRRPSTLTVFSHAAPRLMITSNDYGTIVTSSVPFSVHSDFPTQYFCTGWKLTGNQPSSGNTNAFTLVHTNNAVLTWQFITGTFATVSLAPVNGQPDVASNAAVTACFSGPVDAGSVDTSSFTIRGSRYGVYSGSFSFPDATTVVFSSSQPWAAGERLTVTLSSGIRNTAGHPLWPHASEFMAEADGQAMFAQTTQALGSALGLYAVLGDLDGDGDLDAYKGCSGTDEVWMNDGGSFTDSGQALGGGANSWKVELGDLDGDGDLDAFAGQKHGCLILENNGSGVFTNTGQTLAPLSSYPALGDVDGDGDLDAFVGNYSTTGKLPDRVWINDGSGTFSDSGQRLGAADTLDAVLGDLDGDGDLDGITAIWEEGCRIWINDGTGVFEAGGILGGNSSGKISLGDLDNDGDLDAVVVNYDEGNKAWFNNGDGTFSDQGSFLGIGSSDSLLGDLDGDGDLDAILINDSQGGNKVWANNGSGQFNDTGIQLNGVDIFDGALGDLDDDGDLDVYMTRFGADWIWLNELSLNITSDHGSTPAPGQYFHDHGTVIAASAPALIRSTFPTQYSCEGWTLTDHAPASGTSNSFSLTLTNHTDLTWHWSTNSFGAALVTPSNGDMDVPATSSVAVYFSEPVDTATVSLASFNVRGQKYGLYPGSFEFPDPTSVVYRLSEPFAAGEKIQVTLGKALQNLASDPLWPGVFEFFVEAGGPGKFFDSGQSFGTSENWCAAFGDFDGDGDLDLWQGNGYGPSQVYLNQGKGVFEKGQAIGSLSTRHWQVALGDVDGDGDLDAVAADFGTGASEVWLNDGSGDFSPGSGFAGGDGCRDVELGDVDGDGDLDALMCAVTYGTSRIWLNDGTGNFSVRQTFGTSYGGALGDLDGDGDLDIVLADYDSNRVYLNNGAGYFTLGYGFGTSWSLDVALGDLDGDGDLDAFVGNYWGNKVWKNNGEGQLIGTGQLLGNADGARICLGDLDGDGDLDAFSANYDGPSSLWINNGVGTFTAGASLTDNASWGGALGDVDGDGNLDIFDTTRTATRGLSRLWINQGLVVVSDHGNPYPPVGNNGFLIGTELEPFAPMYVRGLFPTQYVCTGWSMPGLDPSAGTDSGFSMTLTNDAVLTWHWETIHCARVTSISPLNGAVGVSSSSVITVTFSAPIDFSTVTQASFKVSSRQHAMSPGSYQAINATTLSFQAAAPFAAGENIKVSLGDSVRDLVGNPLWPFASGFRVQSGHYGNFKDTGQSMDANQNSWGIALGDLDGDGDLDAFVGKDGANLVWRNNGRGWFSPGPGLNTNSTRWVATGDLDGDGDLDVFVANLGANKVWLNDGLGDMTDSGQELGDALSDGVALGDLDGDGDLDAFVANGGANRVWRNSGNGVFTESSQPLGSSSSLSVALADLDGDGDLDAYVANYGSGGSDAVWLNDGNAWFVSSGQGLGSDNGCSVSLGDLDADGDIDAFTANAGANRAWFNDGSGTFTAGSPLGGWTSFAGDLGDINGDGDLDAFAGNNVANVIWENDGSGTLTSLVSFGNEVTKGVEMGDLDGDGDLDAFTANITKRNIAWLYSTMLTVISDHGSPVPSVGDAPIYHAYQTNSVASPVEVGGTQFVCTGWTMTGHDPASGVSNHFSTVMTNDATLTWLWGETNFLFTRAATTPGAVAGDPEGWYTPGASVTVTAIANEHCYFSGWTGDVPAGLEMDNPLTLTLDAERNVTATFVGDPVELEVVSLYGSPEPSVGFHTNEWGALTTNWVDPALEIGNTQYACIGWTLPDNVPETGTDNSFEMNLTNSTVLTWLWATNVRFNTGFLHGGEVGWGSDGFWPRLGSSISVTAAPDPNYEFSGWAGDVSPAHSNDNPLVLTMDGPKSIQASFTLQEGFSGPFDYRMKIFLDGYDREESLHDFPLLVNLHEGLTNFSYSGFSSDSGGDLRFSDAAESIFLDYEIEDWNDLDGNSFVWVRVPEVNPTSSWIWAYWGSAVETNPLACTTNGAVWASGYRGVWHLHEQGNDSTAYRNYDSEWGIRATNGTIAGAINFPGPVGSLSCGNDASLKPSTQITISAWVKADVFGFISPYQHIYRKEDGNSRHLFSFQDSGNILSFGAGVGGNYKELDVPINGNDYIDTWHLVTATYDGSAKRVYCDGIEIGTETTNGLLSTSGTAAAFIGSKGGGTEIFVGTIDEVRLSEVARSSNWLWACWLNQSGGLVSFSEPEVFDTDDDGYTNPEERYADTDPASGDSFLEVVAISNGRPVTITFPSSSNRLYSLEYFDDIPAGQAEIISGQELVPGASPYSVLVDSNEAAPRYYRIRVTRP